MHKLTAINQGGREIILKYKSYKAAIISAFPNAGLQINKFGNYNHVHAMSAKMNTFKLYLKGTNNLQW